MRKLRIRLSVKESFKSETLIDIESVRFDVVILESLRQLFKQYYHVLND